MGVIRGNSYFENAFKLAVVAALVSGVAAGVFGSRISQAQDSDGCVISQPQGWGTYTVQRGDTMFAIAARFGTTFDELALVNCVENPRVIFSGMELFVPPTDAAADAPAAAATAAPQAFVVGAGAGVAPGNSEVLVFAPQVLNVHRGDTVAWAVNGFHNVRFTDEGLLPLVLLPGEADVEIPQFNPGIAFPTIDSGATYQGGPANSGLPAPPGFSLVIDLPPGAYNYLCDVHPGMTGVINVVDDATPVLGPAEVVQQAIAEIGGHVDPALALMEQAESGGQVATADTNGIAHIQADVSGAGRVTVQQFFPFTAVINVGESVMWTVPDDAADPHTVTWPPLRNQDIVPIPQEAGPPILGFGPGFTPNIPANGEVGQGTEYNSALLFPGQTFSLTFTEPGAYPFVCNIHPGMEGTVVVLPGAA